MVLGMIVGCGSLSSNKLKESEVKVMTTFYPMYDFTKNVVGKEGSVELMIPATVEPHEFEPSVKDMANLTEMSVFIYNSKNLETWVSQVEKTIDSKNTEMINASKGINFLESSHHEEEHHYKGKDPHVWLSPRLAMKEVKNICEGLVKKFPNKKKVFIKNAQDYLKRLKQLDADYKTAFQNAHARKFVTSHAAFSYLAKDYDLEQIAITGVSPEEEPTSARLVELKQYVEKEKIQVIYFEETVSSKIAKTLAKEAGVAIEVLSPLEGLPESEIKAGKDYLSVMRENLKSLQRTIK
ncbi:MAG: metal ABC transporter substrate-binding protein [Lactobacillales bacterium]|jgi:zinc transport system substrate-binding protein|nr:metal ABC transporter substrate-binding protein [Lactobacillales bacterium]